MRIKLLNLTVITVAALLFSGCGGGGGGGEASFKNGETIIPISINCIGATVADIATYIPLQGGDSIVKDDSNTSVKIYHDISGEKKVCLVSGSAHIVR